MRKQAVIATCAFPAFHDVSARLDLHLRYIDEAAVAGADLVVFPETSLQGYPPETTAEGRESALEHVYDTAEPVPGGEHADAIADKAAERGMYVVYGLTEAGERRGIAYNTAILTGPDGHIGKFRKVHLGVGEQAYWRPGDDWPVFDTALGRVGLLICYDKMWPESCRELTLRGADVLIMPAAWGRLAGHADGDANPFVRLYDLYDRVRAAENGRWFVSANLMGKRGADDFFGLSRIVNPLGDVVATTVIDQTGLAIATVDIEGGMATARKAFEGAFLIRDRRPETYRCLRGEEPVRIDG